MVENIDVDALVDELIEAADEAAEASAVYTNAGKGTIEIVPRHWVNSQIVEITPKQYKELPVSAGQKEIALRISVDVKEFKPDLEFGYNRDVVYRKKDWYDTLKPSVAMLCNVDGYAEATTDEERKKIMRNMSDKAVFTALMGLNGKYMFTSDVNSTTGRVSKSSQKPIKTVRIDQVFDTRAEFMQAYTERFGEASGVAAQVETVPPGYASIENFKSDVRDLRSEGMSNTEIASALSTTVEWVSQV